MATKTAVRTKKPSDLEIIATGMRQTVLTDTGARFMHYRLERGLELVLERRDNRWRLALARADVAPSDHEIEICRAAFGVPVDTDTDSQQ